MICQFLLIFPLGFGRSFYDILYISPHIFPTGFLEETNRDDDDQDVDDDVYKNN